MDDGYRALFVRGRPRRLIGGLAVAWLSFGMVGLAIFLAAHRATGSDGLAGLAVGAFSLGSGALAPLRGRLLDRRGARPWLPLLAAGYGIALLALAAAGRAGGGPGVLVACAAAGGASAPPIVASARALWPSVVEEALLRRAYAVTSVVGDLGLVGAPALAALLYVWAWWLPLAVSAAAAGIAGAAVARSAGRPGRSSRPRDAAGRLLRGRFLVLLAVEVALGGALGLVEVAVPAGAAARGETASAGLLLAVFALGSVLGGVWFGRREWRLPAERRYLLGSLALAAGLLLPAAATAPAGLAPLLLAAGLGYGPVTISLFEALDDLAGSRPTEAFTWVTTAGALGAAAGSAAAGWATTGIAPWAPFVAAAAVLGAAAALGLAATCRRPS